MACQLMGSGWYSTNEKRDYLTFGDEGIRQTTFRALWWKSVETFAKPDNVVIVDSASPLKPNDELYTTKVVKQIELLINPGHSQNCKYHYCGAMVAIISIMEYALYNDVDYILYIEQDALIYGDKFIKLIEKELTKSDLVFGTPTGPIQQSVFAINKRAIRKFVANLHSIDFSDKDIMPEIKFMLAGSRILSHTIASTLSYSNKPIVRRFCYKMFSNIFLPIFKNYSYLPFGYGRIRPLNFDDETFYFQQGSTAEILKYKEKAGF